MSNSRSLPGCPRARSAHWQPGTGAQGWISKEGTAPKCLGRQVPSAVLVSFSSVQSVSCVWFFATQWSHQASLSITNSRSLLTLMSIDLVMPSKYRILCHPHLLLPSIFPSIRVFSNESVLHKYWSCSFSISPSNEYLGLISFRIDWLDLLAVWDSQESSPTPQFKSNSSTLSFLYSPTLISMHDHWKNHSLD